MSPEEGNTEQPEHTEQDNTKTRKTEDAMATVIQFGESGSFPHQLDRGYTTSAIPITHAMAKAISSATSGTTSNKTTMTVTVPTNARPSSKVVLNDTIAAIKRKQKVLDMKKFTGAPTAGLDPEAGFVIPENFASVWNGVYRSSFPKEETFEFVRHLKLKSILTLFPEDYPEKNLKFMKEVGIQHFQIGMPGNKEPFVNIPKEGVARALKVVLDRRNHPVLIHCNKGKHRTGCVVGCLRKIQQWGLTLIFDEYRRHSHPKSRALDQQFIELFDQTPVMDVALENDWIPKRDSTPACISSL
ncbi:hypothetical protein L211DRAFT_388802 [Terfezia boudieri ATCC MYA-4762]|uniref:diphosphoinositol-polyphosphate diphosphatase n=1 Tax=Terfezia boudieri ATCC MYA-4762 TaxID=1051890 RepID=A0A3N4LZZ5_9PEZI|nr:hypothetical protein L211DRAFT_388802 [Terfezia boudieri ATCC MYA-4762]